MSDVPLVRLLSMAVTVALEELHTELSDRGHGVLRPAHGYALNAVLNGRNTVSEMAPLLGMTKQGAAKLVQMLIDEGYLAIDDASGEDARRKPLLLTEKGRQAVQASVEIQDRIEREWAELVGPRRMSTTRTALERAVTNAADGGYPPVRPGW
ncbi:MarR family winged helix-turn-helix transcriptional regulator [Nocardioides taihuensis]|uniref:MarR family winged helix-turn-helix transcriptional regulator n=1 Tax=Nocardioides taihuensis TaxID=1835606 RepID=A0ABW0BGZ7_9ACTN